jgi:hypothetical protein
VCVCVYRLVFSFKKKRKKNPSTTTHDKREDRGEFGRSKTSQTGRWRRGGSANGTPSFSVFLPYINIHLPTRSRPLSFRSLILSSLFDYAGDNNNNNNEKKKRSETLALVNVDGLGEK